MLDNLGRFPQPGDTLGLNGLQLEVREIDGHAITSAQQRDAANEY